MFDEIYSEAKDGFSGGGGGGGDGHFSSQSVTRSQWRARNASRKRKGVDGNRQLFRGKEERRRVSSPETKSRSAYPKGNINTTQRYTRGGEVTNHFVHPLRFQQGRALSLDYPTSERKRVCVWRVKQSQSNRSVPNHLKGRGYGEATTHAEQYHSPASKGPTKSQFTTQKTDFQPKVLLSVKRACSSVSKLSNAMSYQPAPGRAWGAVKGNCSLQRSRERKGPGCGDGSNSDHCQIEPTSCRASHRSEKAVWGRSGESIEYEPV